MTVHINTFPGSIFGAAVVTGGNADDPDPGQQCLLRFRDPTKHFSGVGDKDLPFVGKLTSPTQGCLETFDPPPENGTLCIYTGTGPGGDPTQRRLCGLLADQRNQQQEIAGNNLLTDFIPKFINALKNAPCSTRCVSDKGAKVYEVVNQGPYRGPLKGVPAHQALASMVKLMNDPIKMVDTALQQFANIPSLSALSNLPGLPFNLGQILNSLTKNQLKRATKNMDKNLLESFQSMLALIGDIPNANGIANRYDPETFIENLITLLSEVKEFDQMISLIERLKYDTSLRGLDKLKDVVLKIATDFGELEFTIDHTGEIKPSKNAADVINKGLQALSSLMKSTMGGHPAISFIKDAEELLSTAHAAIPSNIRNLILNENCKKTKPHSDSHLASCTFNALTGLKI